MRAGAEGAMCAGILLLPLQWFPAMPLPGMQLADVAFAVAVVATALSRPDLRGRPRSALVALAMFAAGAALSAIANAGSYVKLLGHIELVLVAAACAVIGQAPDAARRLRMAIVVAAVCAAVLGLAGAALFFAGEPTALLNHYGDLLPGAYPRVRGTCVRANMLASVLAVGAIVLAAEPNLIARRALRVAALAVIFAALLFTFSRTGLALALALVALPVLRRPSRARVGLLATSAALVVAGLLVSVRYESLLDPTHPWDISLSGAPGTRWIHWSGALRTALDHPLLGIGPGRAPDGVWSAHMAWINVWATLGLVPLVAFAVLLARVARPALWRAAPGLAAALAILLVDSITTDVEDMRHLWIVVGLLLAIDPTASGRRYGP